MSNQIKNIIKYFDFFGVSFNLKYKHYEFFKSFFGGLLFILFLIGIIIYSLISLISFCRRDKMTINYYDSQIAETDIISFDNYSYGIGFFGYCDTDEETKIFNDLFSYEFHYVSIEKKNGEKQIKKKYQINTHLCQYSDFYYYSNFTMDLIGVTGTYFCPDSLNDTIQGVFTDDNFDYFEITLLANYAEADNYTIYYNLLASNDCKLHFFFPVSAINMNNHTHPFEHNLFDIALQLNPTLYTKRDIFFRVQKFQTFQHYFLDISHTKYYLDYASYNDYYLYKSTKRFSEKFTDYEKFARIYLRADTKRTNISREYEKVSYLIANISSLFSTIFLFLSFFISYINKFYAYNSVIRKIFKFSNVHGTNTFHLLNNLKKQIKITNVLKAQNLNVKNYYNYDYLKEFSENIVEVKSKSNKNIRNLFLTIKSNQNNEKRIKSENQEKNDKNESTYLFIKNESNGNIQNLSNIHLKSFQILNSNKMKFNTTVMKSKKNKKKTITLKYYSYEALIYLFCRQLSNGNLAKKNSYMQLAVDKLLINLDIHVYYNKMHMIELLNFILFEPYQNSILKLISKPYISLESSKPNLVDYLPKIYRSDLNFQEIKEFSLSYNKILNSSNKNKIDEKLFNMVNIDIENLFE